MTNDANETTTKATDEKFPLQQLLLQVDRHVQKTPDGRYQIRCRDVNNNNNQIFLIVTQDEAKGLPDGIRYFKSGETYLVPGRRKSKYIFRAENLRQLLSDPLPKGDEEEVEEIEQIDVEEELKQQDLKFIEPDVMEVHTSPSFKMIERRMPSDGDVTALIERRKKVMTQLVDTSDFEKIKGKRFLKKSGWRKFSSAFGINLELISKRFFELRDDIHAEVRIKATAPNGQSAEGIGLKSMKDLARGNKELHNLMATAWTRAANRAISDLVGFGEVSAEELQ